MKKIIITGLLVVIALVTWFLNSNGTEGKRSFRFVTIERGDVESVVASTGTLQAKTSIKVGTQVSGQIEKILVDYNDQVSAGELIAQIDPTILEQEVRNSEANLERNQAELAYRQLELERSKSLFESEVFTESQLNTAKYQFQVAQATVKSAQVNLERARQNLSYAEIRAPIDGVVLDRTADVGQTVAASMSTPQLFLIAADLSSMEILAAVDESDIGLISPDQPVRFTVQAYPDKSFTGSVGQIRLQPATQENVVNYTIALSIENPDGCLLPGMTATVEFITAQAVDTFRIPNSALRFRATDEMRAEVRERRQSARGNESERGERTAGGGGSFGGAQQSSRSMLWYVDDDGEISVTPVRVGISDGQYTEIAGSGIEEGMQIIAAVTTASASETVNPFQNSQNNSGGRRPGGGPPPGI